MFGETVNALNDFYAEANNKECFRCKTKIIKEKIAGRGTHFCPECQKL